MDSNTTLQHRDGRTLVSFRCSEELWTLAKIAATRDGTPAGELVTRAIAKELLSMGVRDRVVKEHAA